MPTISTLQLEALLIQVREHPKRPAPDKPLQITVNALGIGLVDDGELMASVHFLLPKTNNNGSTKQ